MEILKQILSECTSLYNIHFNCLNITKCDTVNFTICAGTVNKERESFKILSIMDTQFKCLLFVDGLRSAGDAEVWTRILSKLEKNPDITLQQVAVECQWFMNLKHDLHMVQQSVPATIPAVNTVQKQQNPTSPGSTHKKSPSAGWNCGSWHFTWKYPFKTPLLWVKKVRT